MKFNIIDEHSQLQAVILGTADSFSQGETINEAMAEYYGTASAPLQSHLKREIDILKDTIIDFGVKVYQPDPTQDVPQQLSPRDIGFVVDDTFVFCNMTRESRKNESKYIQSIIQNFQGKTLLTPENVFLEGGNVMIDRNIIFVGIGLRTSANAVNYLRATFGNDFKIVPIILSHAEEIIHLDAVLNFLDSKTAVMYSKGIDNLPVELTSYDLIDITQEEKALGGCNFLNLDSKTKIFRNNLDHLVKRLEKHGYSIHIVPWDELKKTGVVGPRCATLPLIRH